MELGITAKQLAGVAADLQVGAGRDDKFLGFDQLTCFCSATSTTPDANALGPPALPSHFQLQSPGIHNS